MWQSWVEIEHYSVPYFNRITAFEALHVYMYRPSYNNTIMMSFFYCGVKLSCALAF